MSKKHNEIELFEKKIELPDCEVFEEMNKLALNKISSKWKDDRIMVKLSNSFNNHKYNKKSNIDLFIEATFQ